MTMDIPDVNEVQRRLDAIPREIAQIVCMNCKKEYTAEIVKGDRFFRCPTCRAARLAEMNNEGDAPSPDGVISSNGACEAGGPISAAAS